MTHKSFLNRHIGPRESDIKIMLEKVGVSTIEELIKQTIPNAIRLKQELVLEDRPKTEAEFARKIGKLAYKNKLYRNFIGMGYYGTDTPAVVQRNILENPVWYTSYTPYQAEISQGRLEALLNYQTVITELTGMKIANASLLDEATAAAEAMAMMLNIRDKKLKKAGANQFFVDKNIFPQTLAVIQTRAEPLGIELIVGDYNDFQFSDMVFGAIVQYPAADGKIRDYKDFAEKAHQNKSTIAVAADILSLSILTPPGEWNADIVVGSTQRLGIPMGFGGPHAGYFATKEAYKRKIPGRIIGVSKDNTGKTALRMALQTREQHIKREKATSNICTAQALLATMAGFYAVYHGAEGLKGIATEIHTKATLLSERLTQLGCKQENTNYFDTLKISLPKGIDVEDLEKRAHDKKTNFRYFEDGKIGISIDEITSVKNLNRIIKIFGKTIDTKYKKVEEFSNSIKIDNNFIRKTEFFTQEIFSKYHSETEMMRYMKKLERRDMSLTHSMISLGSCTMKLNSATSMFPLTNPHFANVHPFVPEWQAKGYRKMMEDLIDDLKEITGFDAVSLQPNSGASGEYAGLLVIRAYQKEKGEGHRNVVLIPASAHGTNPASASMIGSKLVIIKCDENGNIDIDDLKQKAEDHKDNLSSFMVTYPSTHGVFESKIMEMCNIIHTNGGQVYMDGANMNAQIGFTNPGIIGADVCHLNLHKTFGIPHGGGGPGVGPIGVAKHLSKYLPTHPVINFNETGINAVAAAPYGSPSVLPISYAYIKMLGVEGLKKSTEIAILNANYIASSLNDYYKILYTGEQGRVAHEMILECRDIKQETGISETDIAKRLIDYGFHAPTLSFPVPGTLMVEPTESESKEELDRFIEAMISIHKEIQEVKDGTADKNNNVLINAPHPEYEIVADKWEHEYSREKAAYPLEWVRENKFWVNVGRIDNAYGDRNLFCTCEAF